MKVVFYEFPVMVNRSQVEVVINFDIHTTTLYDDKNNTPYEAWEGRSVVIRKYCPSYNEIVSALIADKYSMDAQISILYNRNGDNMHEAEYDEYQSWRAYCKDVAKQVVTELGYSI